MSTYASRAKQGVARRLKNTVGKNAGLNPSQKKQIKSMISRTEEDKQIDFSSAGNSVNSGGIIIGPVTVTSQGSADGQRLGDKQTLKMIDVHQTLICGDSTNFVRVIWFQWYVNNATTTPLMGSIIENTGVPIQSSLNHTNDESHLFRVISDKVYSLTTSGSNQCLVVNKKFYGRSIPRKIIEYNPSAQTGFYHVYCLVVSDSIAAPNPSYNLYSRTIYTDS